MIDEFSIVSEAPSIGMAMINHVGGGSAGSGGLVRRVSATG
jgi:hypothetical protein